MPGSDRELDGDEALLGKVILTYPLFGKRVLADAGEAASLQLTLFTGWKFHTPSLAEMFDGSLGPVQAQ